VPWAANDSSRPVRVHYRRELCKKGATGNAASTRLSACFKALLRDSFFKSLYAFPLQVPIVISMRPALRMSTHGLPQT
jgi:hypothetical protein